MFLRIDGLASEVGPSKVMTYIIFLHIANELDPVLFVSQLQIVFHFPTRVFLQPVVLVIPDSYYFPDAEKYFVSTENNLASF